METLEDRSLPSNLAAPVFTVEAESTSEIHITWKAVHGATNYLVDESIDNAWQQIDNPSSRTTSFTLSGLTAGDTYSFEVAAANSSGSTFAQSQSVTTLPDAPTFAATATSSSEVDLSWNAAAGATGYQIEEFIKNAWKQISSQNVGVTTFPVTGLAAGTTYRFNVLATDAGGVALGTQQSAITDPAAPVFTATVVSSSEIHLAWKAVHSATSYRIDEQINNTWQQIETTKSTATSFTLRNRYETASPNYSNWLRCLRFMKWFRSVEAWTLTRHRLNG